MSQENQGETPIGPDREGKTINVGDTVKVHIGNKITGTATEEGVTFIVPWVQLGTLRCEVQQ